VEGLSTSSLTDQLDPLDWPTEPPARDDYDPETDDRAWQATADLDPRYVLNDRRWIPTKYQQDQTGRATAVVADHAGSDEPGTRSRRGCR
jgi:hypothetical protein